MQKELGDTSKNILIILDGLTVEANSALVISPCFRSSRRCSFSLLQTSGWIRLTYLMPTMYNIVLNPMAIDPILKRGRTILSISILVCATAVSLHAGTFSDSWSQQIVFGYEDAEESGDSSVNLRSGDLDIGQDPVIALRFSNANIPQGAVITSAHIQFTSDGENRTDPSTLTIRAEAADSAGAFRAADGDLSMRNLTSASVSWSPAGWIVEGERTVAQQTPDISAVIQEVVNRAGWEAGNELVLFILGSSGKRGAVTFEQDPSNAPELSIHYEHTRSVSDSKAPSPSTTRWASPPHPLGAESIRMQAEEADDPSGVEYYFEATSAGGNDSGWQTSSEYTDSGLAGSTSYSYRVKSRDRSENLNESAPSTIRSATTTSGDVPVYYRNPGVLGADPMVVDGLDGKYYLFVSEGSDSARYESNDLVNWSQFTSIDNTDLAPEVIYHPESGNWYMYANFELNRDTSVIGAFPEVKDEFGFDQMYFRTPGGDQFLYTGGWKYPREVRELSDPETVTSVSNLHYLEPWWGSIYEGQILIENAGLYYLMLSINGANQPDYRLAYATGPTPLGPFTMQTPENANCFLRESRLEGIYGPGHHGMFEDAEGIHWVYYQQKDSTATAWDRRIAMDPLWFDASGVPHMRPTRSKGWRPGPGHTVEQIWPGHDALSWVEGEQYDGSSVLNLRSRGDGLVLDDIQSGAYAAYRRLDFGAGATGFEVELSSATSAGAGPDSMIEIRLGGVEGTLVGVCFIDNTGGWNSYTTASANLYQTVTGVNDVVLVFHGFEPETDLMRIERFRFTDGAASAPVVRPPLIADERLTVANVGTTIINVLDNDNDPDGDSLIVSGVAKSAEGGVVAIEAGQTAIAYTPPSGFWGEDRIVYAVSDQTGHFRTGEVLLHVAVNADTRSESRGALVIEAEDFIEQEQGSDPFAWSVESSTSGYVGSGYVTTPDDGTTRTRGSRLHYAVEIQTPGRYVLWARMRGASTASDKSWLGFNSHVDSEHLKSVSSGSGSWDWVRKSEFDILRAGLHRLTLARGEDGHEVDRFVLTTDADYLPANVNGGVGPLSNYSDWSNFQPWPVGADSTTNGNPDGDPSKNLLEFLFGLDPLNHDNGGNALTIEFQEGSEAKWLILDYRRNKFATSHSLVPEISETLAINSWEDIIIDGTDAIQTVIDKDLNGDGRVEKVRLQIKMDPAIDRLFLRLSAQ